MEIQPHVPLSKYTTFKTGGLARLFCIVENVEELHAALDYAKQENVQVYPIGGGSNILVGMHGFDGLIIKIEIQGITVVEEDAVCVLVRVGAGVEWDACVAYAVTHEWYGIENLAHIPGSVGAAPIQNIGAYGIEVQSAVHEVEAIDTRTGSLRIFSNTECVFGYRDSFFKTKEGKNYIIMHVTFRLSKVVRLTIDYKDLEQYFVEHKNIEKNIHTVRAAVIDVRTRKLPDWRVLGTAGSFFKNPIILRTAYEELKEKHPDMPMYEIGDAGKIKTSAAFLIDKVAGLKGSHTGDVSTYQNQALVVVNNGHATGEEVLAFSEMIVRVVNEKSGITLEREVQILGV